MSALTVVTAEIANDIITNSTLKHQIAPLGVASAWAGLLLVFKLSTF